MFFPPPSFFFLVKDFLFFELICRLESNLTLKLNFLEPAGRQQFAKTFSD